MDAADGYCHQELSAAALPAGMNVATSDAVPTSINDNCDHKF